jgi:hypothetical protein
MARRPIFNVGEIMPIPKIPKLKVRYLYNDDNQRKGVLINAQEFEQFIEILEAYSKIIAFDKILSAQPGQAVQKRSKLRALGQ